ncbi:2-C-methyl-D-erythritol 4-phosphate cytidylyltransferase [bacterium]|nr:2-C-methyl-D-erythritol 4-phosphate cytidylyltransferase [bacterium]
MQRTRVAAILVAAGRGSRFSVGVRKQYQLLAGKPILYHTLACFCSSPDIDCVVTVVPAGERADAVQRISGWPLLRSPIVVEGGEERHHSVMNGLEAVPPECEWILVHDGVRPFVTHELILRVLKAARREGGAVAAVTPCDTIKTRVDQRVGETLERSRLVAVQTPQAFRRSILQQAYAAAAAEGRFSTDDAALVERLGQPVALVEGDYRNIKITTSIDLAIAGAIMEGWNQ